MRNDKSRKQQRSELTVTVNKTNGRGSWKSRESLVGLVRIFSCRCSHDSSVDLTFRSGSGRIPLPYDTKWSVKNSDIVKLQSILFWVVWLELGGFGIQMMRWVFLCSSHPSIVLGWQLYSSFIGRVKQVISAEDFLNIFWCIDNNSGYRLWCWKILAILLCCKVSSLSQHHLLQIEPESLNH